MGNKGGMARRLGGLSVLTLLAVSLLVSAWRQLAASMVTVGYQEIVTGFSGSPRSGIRLRRDPRVSPTTPTMTRCSWSIPIATTMTAFEPRPSGSVGSMRWMARSWTVGSSSGVWEPTGVDYDPDTNRLFVTTDARLNGANTGNKNFVLIVISAQTRPLVHRLTPRSYTTWRPGDQGTRKTPPTTQSSHTTLSSPAATSTSSIT